MFRLCLAKERGPFWATVQSHLRRAGKLHQWLEDFVQDSPQTLNLAERTGLLVLTEEAICLLGKELQLDEFDLDTLLFEAGYESEETWRQSFVLWSASSDES